MSDNPFRALPAVHEVLAAPALGELTGRFAHDSVVAAVRDELTDLRRRLTAGALADGEVSAESVAARAAGRLLGAHRPAVRSVINATGIVLHTNLGRSPLAEAAARAAYEAGRGYLNLEMALDSGKRSSRQDLVRGWLCRLTGAESATAVNNCAAATVITLRALARGKEVVVSRGQLVEIGGSFRIPEIMAVSGATLREVGTTNITRLGDYEAAVGPQTGMLLRVHASNYRLRGFTKSVSLTDLVALGRKAGLPVVDDVGSGAMLDYTRFNLPGEPVVRESIAAGADLVLCSGDKLLGGPQAGLIVGRSALVKQTERDPLMRAFRLDKMTLAALEATLRLYLNEAEAMREVPILRMLGTPLEELRRRAESLADQLRSAKVKAEVRRDEAYVGGGSLPDQALSAWVVAVAADGLGEEELAARLRAGEPAVVARVKDGRVLFDVRTVLPGQEEALAAAVRGAAGVDGGDDGD